MLRVHVRICGGSNPPLRLAKARREAGPGEAADGEQADGRGDAGGVCSGGVADTRGRAAAGEQIRSAASRGASAMCRPAL